MTAYNACMFELTQPVGKASREPLPGSGGASLLMFTRETNTYLQNLQKAATKIWQIKNTILERVGFFISKYDSLDGV